MRSSPLFAKEPRKLSRTIMNVVSATATLPLTGSIIATMPVVP